ncbi:hypothetical protein J2W32_000322 [Variovorax boronicumulans]|uniref:DUF1833 domain-containing protein n=1 Tax=Variovorax boronicumulans TaxID=436515 RepID=A0AAW8CRU8_9BURK|nr:hypothetical protein [Variovorax boronicumulans]MDP9891225.1 hypothetical protein [Variovorax boronicumulans]MDQ0051293.1 hypothetical protein [Variovorax boronicumulans]
MQDLETRLRIWLSSAPQHTHAIQTIELSHSAMSKVWRLWREPYAGEITTEDGVVEVLPVNLDITLAGSEGNLDQKFDVAIDTVEINDLFRRELDRIPVGTTERLRAVYREYLSDDLTESQTTAVLQGESVSYRLGEATISAVSPRLNVTRTGETYTTRDVPMLRAYL